MRFKYLFLSLMLLILACSITAIAAADDYESLGDYTFDIPDGFNVTEKSDEMVVMQTDENHSVTVSKLDGKRDFNLFKAFLQNLGCEFQEGVANQSGNFNVTEYNITSENVEGNMYLCDDGKNLLLVSTEFPPGEKITIENNPAKQVVDSLE